jgi:hypothetical protein
MIAVIKGDITASRKLKDQSVWQVPLKKLLSGWGTAPADWEIVWGDSFQLEADPETVLQKAITIKALLKSLPPEKNNKKKTTLDARMAIGIGEKDFAAPRISESNGPAFIRAAEKFDKLKKERTSMAIQSPWEDFDEEINLYLKLAGNFMDNWSVSSAELVLAKIAHPRATQEEIGKMLGIKQNSVSGRWNRAKLDEILEIEKMYKKKLIHLRG